MADRTHFELNEVTKRLPKHLNKYIIKQSYIKYTAKNQAVWRYIMRINADYLNNISTYSYKDGLEKTGISIDTIPRMEEINTILQEIGWAAVAVEGYVPNHAFMDFLAHNVLIISSSIRTIDHLEYNPNPDIIHEAAGRAPIIVIPEYAEYLRRIGELGTKAISCSKDRELFRATRLLSKLKADINATAEQITNAENTVRSIQSSITEPSEMTKIRNLYWWTIEYGLIGAIESPEIFGASLLASTYRTKSCLQNTIKKELNLDAANTNYDITATQNQLFITPDFAHLGSVLEELADTMAVRKGGLASVKKLIASEDIGTVKLSTGLQVSGIFTNVLENENGDVVYVETSGKTALAFENKELVGHGINYHKNGFGFPVGRLKGINTPLENMKPNNLKSFEIYERQTVELDFETGVHVQGTIVKGRRDLKGNLIMITFKDVVVTYNDHILFEPENGLYDMVVGEEIVSAYAGAADENSFEDVISNIDLTIHPLVDYTEAEKQLFEKYIEIKQLRESNTATDENISKLFEKISKEHPNDWLLALELYELSLNKNFSVEPYIAKHLNKLGQEDDQKKKLINQGLEVLGANLHEKLEWDYLTFLKKGTKQ